LEIDGDRLAGSPGGPQPGLGLGQKVAHPRIGRLAVQEPGDQGLLLRAVLGAAHRRGDVLGALEERGTWAEERMLAGAMEELEGTPRRCSFGQIW